MIAGFEIIGEDIRYRPKTSSTPALEKMYSDKKVHEDKHK